MKEGKTFWEKETSSDVGLWKSIDDKNKKRKVTPNEPRTWTEDEDNIREAMRKSSP